MTGLGLGPVAIREFTKQFVFVYPALCAVVTDPEEGNLRSLRAFKKAGFRVVKIVQLAERIAKGRSYDWIVHRLRSRARIRPHWRA
jgi:RimJ/RimL family protein N-acetyltransferase